jgi:hypothetical protein
MKKAAKGSRSTGLWEIKVTFILSDEGVNSYSHFIPCSQDKNSF